MSELITLDAWGVTDTGCVRERNEDRILVDAEHGLYLVADGMGGHSHGEMAAELAITTIRHYIDSSSDRLDVTWPFGYNFNLSVDANRLINAVQLANRHVWRQAESAPEFSGMGTTVAAVLANANKITIGNVGDSRVYLWREGSLHQLTVDDTWVHAISGRGAANVDAFTHPMRSFLTQAVGSKDAVEVHIAEEELMAGDLVILTSDGIHGFITDGEIASSFCACEPLEQVATTLLQKAKTARGSDNMSVVVLSRRDRQ
jgi:serine/threonine protein phosphatase PrpC